MKAIFAAVSIFCLSHAARAEGWRTGPVSPASAPVNLIENGSFSSGDLAFWAQGGNTAYTSATSQTYDGLAPRTGPFYALLGPVGSDGTLTQGFQDTVGQALTISFALAGDGGTANDFAASFDGHTLLAVANQPAQGWTEYDFTVAATGLDSLAFAFRDDPGYWGLTDISVTAAPVPEPAGLLAFTAGLAALALLRRRAPPVVSQFENPKV